MIDRPDWVASEDEWQKICALEEVPALKGLSQMIDNSWNDWLEDWNRQPSPGIWHATRPQGGVEGTECHSSTDHCSNDRKLIFIHFSYRHKLADFLFFEMFVPFCPIRVTRTYDQPYSPLTQLRQVSMIS